MKAILVSTATLALVACSSSVGPSSAELAGNYSATTVSITTIAGSTDLIDRGGSLSLSLFGDGRIAGRLLDPSQGVDQHLTGTWVLGRANLRRAEVTFRTNSEFLNGLVFTASRDTLRAELRPGVDAGVLVIFRKEFWIAGD